jgi:hypothetical protein
LAQHVTVFEPKARIASVNSRDYKNSPENGGSNNVGLVVTIDVTDKLVNPSVVFTIQGKDPTSGKYYPILASAAITTSGETHVLRVHPDLMAAANTVAKDMLPAVWRVVAAHADSDSITYSVGASMV